ncbi:hypothetical protein GCM10009554_39120 [Kribbella koreensis]|uniref:Uncharacterized protein n=1 Tax=Kribbella koreensis TaxID=57909 RepID=A0ABP4B1Q3_9ACTN
MKYGISSVSDAIRKDDLAAEGEPEVEFNVGIAGRLPRKTAAAGALIRDDAGRILFLSRMVVDPGEARGYEFLSLDEAAGRLRPSLARRIAVAVEAVDRGVPVYAEFGRSVSSAD